jgi:hypothetical protein
MITSNTGISVTVGGQVVLPDAPINFNNQTVNVKNPVFELLSVDFNSTNYHDDNLSTPSNESVYSSVGSTVSDPGGCFVATSDCNHFHQRHFYKGSSAGSCHACVEQFKFQKISLGSSPHSQKTLPEDITGVLTSLCFPWDTTMGTCLCTHYNTNLTLHTVCIHSSQSPNYDQESLSESKVTGKK